MMESSILTQIVDGFYRLMGIAEHRLVMVAQHFKNRFVGTNEVDMDNWKVLFLHHASTFCDIFFHHFHPTIHDLLWFIGG